MKLMDAASLANLGTQHIDTSKKRSQILAQVGAKYSDRLKSKKFYLLTVPTNTLADPSKDDIAIGGPIIVDINAAEAGKLRHGYAPRVIVVSGQKEFETAHTRRLTRVTAWVGELAAKALGINIIEETEEKLPEVTVKQKSLAEMSQIERALDACVCEDAAKIKASKDKEICAMRNGFAVTVGAARKAYQEACSDGDYEPNIEASAPAGWEGVVKKMKSHPDIDNPYALTHWMDQQGYQPAKEDKKK